MERERDTLPPLRIVCPAAPGVHTHFRVVMGEAIARERTLEELGFADPDEDDFIPAGGSDD